MMNAYTRNQPHRRRHRPAKPWPELLGLLATPADGVDDDEGDEPVVSCVVDDDDDAAAAAVFRCRVPACLVEEDI